MIDDGVIKFSLHWEKGQAPTGIADLVAWRNELRRVGLIGAYPDGVGFGNVSTRQGSGFVISASGTGGVRAATPSDFTLVTAYDIAANEVHCRGPTKASSESLTHAAVYEVAPEVTAVMHFHNRALWEAFIDRAPTTSPDVPYGTPEMAHEVARVLAPPSAAKTGVFVMGGHEEGLVTFGKSLDQAGTRALDLLASLTSAPFPDAARARRPVTRALFAALRRLPALVPDAVQAEAACRTANHLLRAQNLTHHLTRLDGYAVCIAVDDAGIEWRFRVDSENLVALRSAGDRPQVRVSGNTVDFLLLLAKASDSGQAFSTGRITVDGDSESRTLVRDLLSELELDRTVALTVLLGRTRAARVTSTIAGTTVDRALSVATDRALKLIESLDSPSDPRR